MQVAPGKADLEPSPPHGRPKAEDNIERMMKQGLARYEKVGREYLEERRLKKSAGWILLWAMGVGAVISGNFFGWNTGLSSGFWGLAIATLVVVAMYLCLVFSIAELTAALPHAGGFYSFVRNALGPTAGYICGVTDTIEYVLSPAVIVVGIGGYLAALLPGVSTWIWWVSFYAAFVGINVRGTALSLRVGLAITAVAAGVLVVFCATALWNGSFDPALLFNIPARGGREALPGFFARGLPNGWFGVYTAIPFAIWFYLGIEQLPLAAEEAHDVVRDVPRALVLGIFTLLLLSLSAMIVNSGVGGGAAAMAASSAPLADGFQAILGNGKAAAALTFLCLTGLVASFHALIFAYGRVLFALSRAGYLPRWLSITSRHRTPHIALLLGGAAGLLCAFFYASNERNRLGAALLYMAVLGAVISYGLVLVSFIALRWQRPQLPRPYVSPLGVPGAMLGVVLSIVALASCLSSTDYWPAVGGVALFISVALAYFLLHSRHRLVANAPEEEVALVVRAEEELAPLSRETLKP